MKKLWAVADSAAAQLKTTFNAGKDGAQVSPNQPSASRKPATETQKPSAPNASSASTEKQYLRLPVESARKLRWYDKADLTALVRTHLREKRELEDGLLALKKLLLRLGVSEADMDLEVKAIIEHASDVKESDEGVASVLLQSTLVELDTLKQQNLELQEELAALKAKYRHGGGHPGSSSQAAMFSLDDDDDEDRSHDHQQQHRHHNGSQHHVNNGDVPGWGAPSSSSSAKYQQQTGMSGVAMELGVPKDLIDKLNDIMNEYESSLSQAFQCHRRLTDAEVELSSAETAAALEASTQMHDVADQHVGNQNNDDGDDDGPESGDEDTRSNTRVKSWVQQQQQQSGLYSQQSDTDASGGLQTLPRDVSPELSGNASAAVRSSSMQATLLAKIQRLERDRAAAEEEVQQLRQQLSQSEALAARSQDLSTALESAQDQIAGLRAAIDAAQADVTTSRAAMKAAEEAAEKKAADVRRLQHFSQGAEAVRRLQDAVAEAEDRAAEATRRCSLLEARLSKAEAAVKDKTKQLQQLQAEYGLQATQLSAAQSAAAGAKEQLQQLQDQVANSTTQQQQAAKAASTAATSEQLSAAQALLQSATQELAQNQAAIAQLEARLRAGEAREARLMAELRESQASAADSSSLAAQVADLRSQVADGKSDRDSLKHYKAMCDELTEGKVKMQEELMATAQYVTQLDVRLREAAQKAEDADARASAAESKARSAIAGVAAEVEARLAAAAANRALWPLPILDEVADLERRLREASSTLENLQVELQLAQAELQSVNREQDLLHKQLLAAEHSAAEQRHASAAKEEELTAALQATQREVDTAVTALRRAEVDKSQALAAAAKAQAAAASLAASAGSASAAGKKWQVQNTVGGGSLYGVADTNMHQASQPQFPISRSASMLSMSESVVVNSAPGGAAGGGVVGDGDTSGMPARTSAGPFSTAYQEQQHQSGACMSRKQGSVGTDLQSISTRASQQQLSASANDFNGHSAALPRKASLTTANLRDRGLLSGRVSTAPSEDGRSVTGGRLLEGVDIVYLKNVVLKFLEAALAGRSAERDSLLPAVAALLQASPAEYNVLRKVVSATAPPTNQMLSALGLKW